MRIVRRCESPNPNKRGDASLARLARHFPVLHSIVKAIQTTEAEGVDHGDG
jgi:hypothetical protein